MGSQCFLMYFVSFSSLSPTLLSNVGAFGVVTKMNVGEIREAGKNQACRGDEKSYPYPYPYPWNFCGYIHGYPWIYLKHMYLQKFLIYLVCKIIVYEFYPLL